jgi:hypothetical protein
MIFKHFILINLYLTWFWIFLNCNIILKNFVNWILALLFINLLLLFNKMQSLLLSIRWNPFLIHHTQFAIEIVIIYFSHRILKLLVASIEISGGFIVLVLIYFYELILTLFFCYIVRNLNSVTFIIFKLMFQ